MIPDCHQDANFWQKVAWHTTDAPDYRLKGQRVLFTQNRWIVTDSFFDFGNRRRSLPLKGFKNEAAAHGLYGSGIVIIRLDKSR